MRSRRSPAFSPSVAAAVLVAAVVPALTTVALSSPAGAASPAVSRPVVAGAVVAGAVVAGPGAAGPGVAGSGAAGSGAVTTPSRDTGRFAASASAVPVGAPQVGAHPVASKITEVALAAGSVGVAVARAGAPVLLRREHTATFQTLGVSWTSRKTDPALTISVRAHGAKGWTAWTALDDDAGDDGTATGPGVRGGTDPLWVGASDGVQARVSVRAGMLPKGLRLELVNPGSSGFDASAAASQPGSIANAPAASATTASATTASATTAGAVPAPAVSASAVTGGVAEPLVLSRAAWGADESKVRNPPTYMPTIQAGVLHHTAGPNNYTPAQVPAIIRGDYAYHLSRGWSDIGYNALVDRFGRIWEGRAGGLDRAVMGAHAGGFNTDTFGMSMIGNYDVARPSAASITAVVRMMAWKMDLNYRDPNGTTRLTSAGGGTSRYAAGTTVTFPVIMGHRDTGRTACPGRYLYPYLPSIRTRVAALMKAALTNPTGPPASAPWGTPVAITARSLAAQSWLLTVTAPCGNGVVARIAGTSAAGHLIDAAWNGRLADGSRARPGRYRLALTASAGGVAARSVVDSVLIVPPAPVAAVPGTASGGAGGYVPVTPTRVFDSRAAGQLGLGPAGRADVPVLGRAQIPVTGVTSVVLNLTASCGSDATSLAVWAAGGTASSRPVTSIPAGATRSVLVTSRVGADGAVSVGNARGVIELTADVVGYYAAAGSPVLATPSIRLYDSRADPTGPLPGAAARVITLPASLAGVSSSQVRAVLVDVSALTPRSSGALYAYRPGAAAGLPVLSYGRGASVDNLAVVPVSGGAIMLSALGVRVNAVLDVRGVVVDPAVAAAAGASAFTATKPTLVYDSATSGGTVGAGGTRKVVVTGSATGVPAGARAVLIDLTGVTPSVDTWWQAYPWGQTGLLGAAVRVAGGQTRGNLVLVPVGSGGAIAVTNARGSSQVRVDVQGYLG